MKAWEAEQAAKKQAVIDILSDREKIIVQAMETAGFLFTLWEGRSEITFSAGEFGYPSVFKTWDEAYEWINEAQLKDTPGLREQVQATYRPYGLDCSGFVDWVFYNATGGEYIIGHGGGAMMQHSYCTSISWAEAQIGDLVFYPEDTHVGIVCGWDESGNILIVHCAFSANNVVITGREGFTSIGRPVFYGGA